MDKNKKNKKPLRLSSEGRLQLRKNLGPDQVKRPVLGKKSKTTYAKWCELKGFKYHCVYSTGKLLPDDWVKEVLNQQKKL